MISPKVNNIILIGLPGAGKSTLGVLLAKTLGMHFLDIDLLIQTGERATLQQIIEERGLDRFCELECRYARSVRIDNAVIATGGSMVYYPEAMTHLKLTGTLLYLEISLAEMHKRLANLKTRGVVMAPGQSLAELYAQRVPLYECYADVRIDTTSLDHEQSLERIVQALGLA